MNETCNSCGNPIHWNQLERKWYHDLLASVLGCYALVVEPADRGLASCGHPADEDGECSCSYWPERAPLEA